MYANDSHYINNKSHFFERCSNDDDDKKPLSIILVDKKEKKKKQMKNLFTNVHISFIIIKKSSSTGQSKVVIL